MIYLGDVMRDLYIDCDGVIFNTIKPAFKEMEELGIDLKNEEAITNYFKHCDWNYLIEVGGSINDSITKIKILSESNCFNTVNVATHRCSYIEGVIKTNVFKKLIPTIKIITIPKKIGKHFAVPVKNNILIDDAKNKIVDWINHGGIGILFSESTKNLIYPNEQNNNYFITNDLLDIIKINDYYKEKTYRKKL